jgi:hypothetical protein
MKVIKKYHREIATTTYDLGNLRGIVYKLNKSFSAKVGDRHPFLTGPDGMNQVHGFQTKKEAEKFVMNWFQGVS